LPDKTEDDENTSDLGFVFHPPPVPQDLAGDYPRCGEGIAVVYQNRYISANLFLNWLVF
jgi:hypothetical protein